ncbi:50S ribosomal protein L21e [archaeon]|nr:MAG: 50S ribosomal protein L21e [archaeon]RLG65701.1 MAG: 50S ribosomal protein L21e [archaeon]HDM23554.1 50S ribosomal protein L21e [Candidatus Bathyarchaeota archaeon]
MAGKSGGPRYHTRHLFRKRPRERGLQPLGRLLRILEEVDVGTKVCIVTDPSVHKGMPFKRFHGKVGTVIEKRGRAYVVLVRDGGKYKKVIVRPEHLRIHEG